MRELAKRQSSLSIDTEHRRTQRVRKSWIRVFRFSKERFITTYEYQGWKIRAAFLQLDGPAVRMDYQKILSAGVNPVIQDYELQAIMNANTPKAWRKQWEAFVAGGQKMWRRTDGAILWSRGNLIVRLELPTDRLPKSPNNEDRPLLLPDRF
jgi:hypothetical protein